MSRLLVAMGAIVAAALLIGSLERRHPEISADAVRRATERLEELPPSARLGHPLERATYIEQSGFDHKGKPMRERRYTPHADLTTRTK